MGLDKFLGIKHLTIVGLKNDDTVKEASAYCQGFLDSHITNVRGDLKHFYISYHVLKGIARFCKVL